MSPNQTAFDPRDLDKAKKCNAQFNRPLLMLATAADVLGLREADVVTEIFAGRVRWAWNLSTSDKRPFIRVLTRSVVCWLLERDGTNVWQPRTIDEAVTAVLPAMSIATGTVTGIEFQKIFRVSGHHVASLVDETHALTERKRAAHAAKTGPNASRLLTRESVVGLLTKTQAPW